ncbi:Gfo/Idh/MocA family protein [Armatimonas rosea]|uniref:Glucose-fructose oxidoreductase n=1 Tax=Armatimonas rosea TaxID=685828 RepID=A0A7W9W829_ARMRO|nr:Gfo/Idh/MocA family oxidoreductase [Armatimonas rosea]MBB6052323.1 glucose-fructose oxidoreductase [Armatimonas rosea]
MSTSRLYNVVGINFDHMHMGDLLRQVHEHPGARLVGIADQSRERMASTVAAFGLTEDQVFTDWQLCLETTKPDIAILCPKTAEHGQAVVEVAPYQTHVLVEKPFAATLADADRMIAAMAATSKTMIINWPLAWYPPHVTTKRLIAEGTIGEVLEVHYYDGNRGPLRHIADKVEITEEEANRQKSQAWWYQREAAGGSLQDYLGYGVTLGTWFLDGRKPLEVTCVTDNKPGLEVDEHSIMVCRYASPYGLSKFETRWGTFTDPWTLQPQPKCGFVVLGTHGTISSYDYEPVIRLQTRERPETHEVPVDTLAPGWRNPIEHLIHHLETGCALHGPLDPALCRIGQQIVDSAVLSARERRTVTLLGE